MVVEDCTVGRLTGRMIAWQCSMFLWDVSSSEEGLAISLWSSVHMLKLRRVTPLDRGEEGLDCSPISPLIP